MLKPFRPLISFLFPLGLALAACQPSTSEQAKTPEQKAAALAPAPTGEPGGPFSLVNQDGAPVTEAVLQGRWSAVYFGYTFCPDVCPTSLQALGEGLKRLGAKGKSVQTVFISIDPARDTPDQLKAYLESPVFPRPIMGLTGTPEQVQKAAKAYKLYYRKAGDGEDYLMDHQSIIYLMNPQGRLARPLTHAQTPDQIAAQIADAMHTGA